MKYNRQLIAYICLAIFCFLQLADLHILSHHDVNDTDCQLCLLCADNQNNGYVPIDITEIPSNTTIPKDNVLYVFEQQYFTTTTDHSFLNKAPPTC